MASDFDHIKNKITEDIKSVPPSLDWGRMENGIFQKMQNIQEGEMSSDNKLKSIVLLLLCLLTICNRSQRTYLSTDYLTTPTNTIVSSENASPSITIEKNTKFKTRQSLHKQTSKQSYNYNLPPAIEQSNDQPIFITSKTIQNSLHQTHQKNKVQQTILRTPVKIISPLPSKIFFVENTLSETRTPSQTISASQEISTTYPIKNQFSISSGIGYWNPNFGNKLPEYAYFEQNILSFTGALHFTHTIKRGYFLSLGIQYQQLESRLDWSTTIEDYEVVLEDTIKTIQNNLISGEVQIIRGNVTLNVNAQRNVRHFNKIQLFQIPLAVGKKWKIRNWEAAIQMGAMLNIASFYQGRTIQLEQLIEIASNTHPFIESQWKIHASAGGQISYYLNNHIGVSANIQYQRSLDNWSKSSEFSMFPSILNLGLGMNYKF